MKPITLMFKRPFNNVNLSILTASVLVMLTQSACANSTNSDWQNQTHAGDAYFNEALKASRSGGDMYQYQQQMAGSNLAMYPEYWQLNQSLSSQSPDVIIGFVKRYQGSAIAEKLVADYAETKAFSGDYASVRAVAGYISNADVSESCAIGLAYQAGGDSMRALIEKNKVWLDTNKKQPELCRQLASQLNNSVMVSNDDRVQRLYRMIRTGNNSEVVALASRLGISLDYVQLADIGNRPDAFFLSLPTLEPTATNRLLYLFALAKVANQGGDFVNTANMQLNYDMRQYPRFFDERTKRYAYRTLGVARMNVNTDIGFSVDAVNWMQKSLGEPFNFEEAEDYATASIRFSRWTDLSLAIGAMDYQIQQQPIWQYWLAKAYHHAGNTKQQQNAWQIFAKLAKKNDYYGLLAKEQLGQRFDRLPTTNAPTAFDYQRLAQDPHFNRAFSLYHQAANSAYSNREWNWAVRKARERGDNGMILAAAKQANDIGWYDRAIFAIETTHTIPNIALAYPMPYQASVVNYSRQVGIDPAWAYGIMRQESRFNVGAKSNVGAGGLMQIMPTTAKEIARKIGESYSASKVATGDTNIRYGTFYMSDIFKQLGANTVLATAGYNAGASKARRWQPQFGSLPADQYIESIPYPETRGYVKAVMENTANYSVLLGENQSFGQRMNMIDVKK
ncbi:lytic transglycosylase subunit [Moraxella macacae 0408225]|uniref:Lytic transglycosylase subunit n=1 Tax=Moraxella macacae 0408225 TaxID=1230338 RepID=L2F5C6_9GAMM|nr:lytic transglycosylase domain-containing protein [Moraxella macacae]ELA08075.1 lytic transglycosylase subunit [Moraxella macacae 0408225]